jgi:predicted Rossmann fold flavoprotein
MKGIDWLSADVLIVGGGAAGLLCAGTAAFLGKRVLALEKMQRPARKILVTGKGRCNLTNNCGTDEFFAAVRTNSRFLHSAFAAFSPRDTIALFEGLGVPLKTERGGRVFPVSGRAMDIADALVRYTRRNGAKIIHKTASSLWIEKGALLGVVAGGGERIAAKSVVLATGGLSYPSTGSDGDGYRLAEQAGHTIIAQRPSLVPIETHETWCSDVMGLSLRNVTLSLIGRERKKPVFFEMGELLFTHFGVSGPLVLSASAHMRGAAADYSLQIDLKPALDENTLDARILRDFAAHANKDIQNALAELLPASLIPVIVSITGIPPHTKAREITKTQRRALLDTMKRLVLTPKCLRPIEEAVITAGGVKVSEVDPKTMQSKILPGLYFAGEILDVDAYTGGFNLQIAFSTGYAAGVAVS